MKTNDYVAVAYQDNWYPGIVTASKQEVFVVKFLVPGKPSGIYTWPLREDVQTVHAKAIIGHGFVPDCMSGGRLWRVKEHAELSELYTMVAAVFFKCLVLKKMDEDCKCLSQQVLTYKHI